MLNSNGFDVQLTKVSNNTVVYSGHVNTAAALITNLDSETAYTVKVWSVCGTGTQGAYAELTVTTDYVIVDDIIVYFSGSSSTMLDNPHTLVGSAELIMAKQIGEANGATFKVEKVSIIGDYQVHVKFNNPEGTSNDNRWLIGGDSPQKCPFNNASIKVQTVYIYHYLPGFNIPDVIKVDIISPVGGQPKITWNAPSNYALYNVTSGLQVLDNPSDVARIEKNKYPFKTDSDNTALANLRSAATPTEVQVSPNPFSDALVLQRTGDLSNMAQVRLFDLNGRQVLQQVFDIEATTITLPTTELPNGMYLVRYETADAVKIYKVFKAN